MPQSWLKPLAYSAVYLGWGTTYLAIRVGIGSLEPASFLALRFLAAAAGLAVPVVLLRAWEGATRDAAARSALQGLLLLVGGLLPMAYSEKTLASSVAAIVIGCAPLGFALFDRLLNGTRIRAGVLLGLAFGVSGVALLSRGGGAVGGAGLALVTTGCSVWCLGSVLSRSLTPVSSAICNVFVQYLSAGVVLLAIALTFEGFGPASLAHATPAAWLSLAYITLFPSLISYSAYLWLLRSEPSSRVSTYAYVNPVVAVLAGSAILGESSSPRVWASLALVLAGTACCFVRKPVAWRKPAWVSRLRLPARPAFRRAS
jgi:drug/metabolite transporter (DMT)-like permease